MNHTSASADDNQSAAPTRGARMPLAGARVLELCQIVAGPFCCMLLGDMGADVIKIEPPGGDNLRPIMRFNQKGPDGLGFMSLNRNKRSMVLDIKKAQAREVLYELVRTADIFVENYRPGVARRLGIDYETLRSLNPRLIYASISGFGQTGPWASRPGYDMIAQAMSGIMSITGLPNQPPVRAGVPLADFGCSLLALYGILSAYIGRASTGLGQYIDASLFETALSFAVWEAAEYWGTGQVPGPLGGANRMSAPYEAVRARDRYFVVAANNPRLWKRFCEVIERRDLMEDKRFCDNASRLANRSELISEIEARLAERSADEWIERLLESGVPAAPILNVGEALDSAHAREREITMDMKHAVEGTVRSFGFPVKFSLTRPEVRRSPPLLGEHTREVILELGLSERVIDEISPS